MSRYGWDGDDGDYPSHWWEIDLARALTSGRGQRILREIEHALRSMPERRLLADAIVEWDDEGQAGAVCAVGAYAAFKQVQAGKTWPEAFAVLAERYGGDADEWETQQLGRSVGLARTVAWHLGWLNDEMYGDLKPRQRWRAILKWTRSQIKTEDQRAEEAPGGGRGAAAPA